MLSPNPMVMYQIANYYNEKVMARKAQISKNIHSMCKIVQDILKEVEAQEPRYISTLHESNGRYQGVHVHSPTEYEVVLYLNQMGVFNFVDDGSVQGCAVLKLSDGRKRSMSLWVEFITASGYLSARKMRNRFQTLVAQAVDKCQYRDVVKMIADSTEVRLRIHDKYVVQITIAFRCNGIWPRSASHWGSGVSAWPGQLIVNEVKSEGFDLFSKEICQSQSSKQAQANSVEGDAWAMSMSNAEDILLHHSCRRKVFAILKCLRDKHLDFPGSPITAYIIKTLVLYECEKHPQEYEWDETSVGDRVIGVLLQLVSCLQCRRCPHYFLPTLDLLKGKSEHLLNQSAKVAWRLARQLILNSRALETL